MHFPMMNPGKQIDNPQRYFVQGKGTFLCRIWLVAIVIANSRLYCSKAAKNHDSLAFYGTEVSFT